MHFGRLFHGHGSSVRFLPISCMLLCFALFILQFPLCCIDSFALSQQHYQNKTTHNLEDDDLLTCFQGTYDFFEAMRFCFFNVILLGDTEKHEWEQSRVDLWKTLNSRRISRMQISIMVFVKLIQSKIKIVIKHPSSQFLNFMYAIDRFEKIRYTMLFPFSVLDPNQLMLGMNLFQTIKQEKEDHVILYVSPFIDILKLFLQGSLYP